LLCKLATDFDMAITPYIWGHRGIGKSASIKQLCQEQGWGFIDFRASQCEAADLRGLPSEDVARNRTIYRPPADMPSGDLSTEEINELLKGIEDPEVRYMKYMELQPRFKHGILFLDELNRAQDDVQQAAFQLILDRRIGQYVMPLGWIVVAAGNFMDGPSYQTNSFMDAAFLSRFCHIIMSSDPDSAGAWTDYLAKKYSDGGTALSDVVEVVHQNLKLLDGDVSGNLGFSVTPNRRGWEMVVRVLRAAEGDTEFNPQIISTVVAGIVGQNAASVMETARLPVKPKDLIKDGIKAHADTLKSLKRDQTLGLMWGMVAYCKSKINEDRYALVCADLMKFLCRTSRDRDLVSSFARSLVEGNPASQVNAVRSAAISNPHLLAIITKNKGSAPPKDASKTFMDYISKDPELSKLLQNTSWGNDADDE
jgi:hypothetical protein